jgi:prevent-host-death family protein
MRQIGAYEAKTHLPRLLEDVAGGEAITITKHGVPVAVLSPASKRSGRAAAEAVAGLREFRRTHRLSGVTVRQLIDEGRR